MDRDRAIQYINELLNSQYDLMQLRKLDSNYELDKDLKEATLDELFEIVNAQEFMRDYITTHIPILEEQI